MNDRLKFNALVKNLINNQLFLFQNPINNQLFLFQNPKQNTLHVKKSIINLLNIKKFLSLYIHGLLHLNKSGAEFKCIVEWNIRIEYMSDIYVYI